MYLGARKRKLFKIISPGIIYALIFSLVCPPQALAARSSAGGGKIAKPDWGRVATNVGISIGSAIVMNSLGNVWKAAQPVTAGSQPMTLQGFADAWLTEPISSFGVVEGASSSLLTTVGSTVGNIGGGIKSMLTTAGNFATNTAGAGQAVKPWTAAWDSLGAGLNLSNIVIGYSTDVATSQVSRAVGMAGQYYGWKPAKTFIFSNVATGATVGFLDPTMALGDALPKNASVSLGSAMVKGAFVGAIGSLASSAAIVSFDGKSINEGKAPGAGAQIAGLFAGEAGTNLARAVVNPTTYQVQVIQAVGPGSYNDVDVEVSENGDLKINDELPSSLLEDKEIKGSFSPEKVKEIESLKEGLNNVKQEINKGIQEDWLSIDSAPDVKEIHEVFADARNLKDMNDKINNLNSQKRGIQEKLLASSVDVDYDSLPPNIGNYTLLISAKSDTVLYRIFVKAPFIDTLSRQSWPGLAAGAVGILISDNMGTDNKWAPLLSSLGSAVSESVFSSIANIGGIGLDLSLGDKHDLTLARLQYIQAVRIAALNYTMDNRLREIDSAFDKETWKEICKEIKNLRSKLDNGDQKKYEEELIKIEQKWGLLGDSKDGAKKGGVSVNPDRPYIFVTDLTNNEEIRKAIGELGLPQSQNQWELEKQLNALTHSTTDLYEFNRNFIRLQERLRVEDKMAFEVVGEKKSDLSLNKSLEAVGVTKFGLSLDNMLRGALSSGFKTAINNAVGIVLIKEGGPLSQQLLAVPIAGLVRGLAWHLGWDYTTKNWEWSVPGEKYTIWDYPEPEKYEGEPGEQGFDLIRYLDYKINYSENLARWERTTAMDSAITKISHPERVKFILTPEGGVEVKPDNSLVAHTVLYNQEHPTLRQHILASLQQASTDFYTGTLSFGRPLVRLNVGDHEVGLESRQVSSAMFMNYVSVMQYLSNLPLAEAINYNARQAAIESVSKSIASSLAQIPLPGKSSIGELFCLQPERLVLKGQYVVSQKAVKVKETQSIGGILHKVTPEGILGYAVKNPKELAPEAKIVLVGKGRGDIDGYLDYGFPWEPSQENFSEEQIDLWRFGAEGIFWGEARGFRHYFIASEGKVIVDSPVVLYGPFELPAPNSQGTLPTNAPQVLLVSNMAATSPDEWFFEYGSIWRTTNTEMREGVRYGVTKPVSYTIENLGYGGGGLPHAAAYFWTPFPNPLYNLLPQTGPTHYLKSSNYSAPSSNTSLPVATLEGSLEKNRK